MSCNRLLRPQRRFLYVRERNCQDILTFPPLSGLPQLFWNPREGLVFHALFFTFLAVKLLPRRSYTLDTFIGHEVNFYFAFIAAPVNSGLCIRTVASPVLTGQTRVALSSPFPIGTLLQFAPSESTCCRNGGRGG